MKYIRRNKKSYSESVYKGSGSLDWLHEAASNNSIQ